MDSALPFREIVCLFGSTLEAVSNTGWIGCQGEMTTLMGVTNCWLDKWPWMHIYFSCVKAWYITCPTEFLGNCWITWYSFWWYTGCSDYFLLRAICLCLWGIILISKTAWSYWWAGEISLLGFSPLKLVLPLPICKPVKWHGGFYCWGEIYVFIRSQNVNSIMTTLGILRSPAKVVMCGCLQWLCLEAEYVSQCHCSSVSAVGHRTYQLIFNIYGMV